MKTAKKISFGFATVIYGFVFIVFIGFIVELFSDSENFESDVTSPSPQEELGPPGPWLEVVDLECYKDNSGLNNDSYKLDGTVKNLTDRTLREFAVIAEFYGGGDTWHIRELASVNGREPVLSGDTASFSVWLSRYEKLNRSISCRIDTFEFRDVYDENILEVMGSLYNEGGPTDSAIRFSGPSTAMSEDISR